MDLLSKTCLRQTQKNAGWGPLIPKYCKKKKYIKKHWLTRTRTESAYDGAPHCESAPLIKSSSINSHYGWDEIPSVNHTAASTPPWVIHVVGGAVQTLHCSPILPFEPSYVTPNIPSFECIALALFGPNFHS